MINEQRIGLVTSADGANAPLRGTKDGALSVTAGHARYTEACYRGQIFSLFSGSITSSEGGAEENFVKNNEVQKQKLICGFFNPTNSGRNAVILNSIISVLQATKQSGPFVYSFQQCPNVTSAATGTIRNNNFGVGPTSVMTAQNNVLLVRQDAAHTATTSLGLVGGNTTGSGLAGTTATPEVRDNVEGKIVVPPGTIFGITCWQQGETATLIASLHWEETPV